MTISQSKFKSAHKKKFLQVLKSVTYWSGDMLFIFVSKLPMLNEIEYRRNNIYSSLQINIMAEKVSVFIIFSMVLSFFSRIKNVFKEITYL